MAVDLDRIQKLPAQYDTASRLRIMMKPEDRDALVREIVRLREENERLRSDLMLAEGEG